MTIKILLAPTWELAEPIEADVTVEAEYGNHIKEGTKQTLAHHTGKYKGQDPVSIRKPAPLGSGTILVSHLDHDTVIACLDLLGKSKNISDEFRRLAGFVDINGPHRINDFKEVSETTKKQLYAWWAYNKNLKKFPKDKITDVTTVVENLADLLDKIMKKDPELMQKGKEFKNQGEALEKNSYVDTVGDILVRRSDQFVNHLYEHNGKIYKGIAALNTKSKSITISLEKPIHGVSCREIVQKLWGSKAGGHDGIAGSPRGKNMSEQDLKDAAKVFNDALSDKSKNTRDWVGTYLGL